MPSAPDAHPPTDRSRPRYLIAGQAVAAPPLSPGLYVVATPIGNLGDITIRALASLAAADTILAEDTRTSRKLLNHYGISTPLLAYHEHNAAEMRPRVLRRLGEGEALALISDAGTPLISDPGYKLVRESVEAGHQVFPIPGPSALLAALVCAGLPTDRFHFEGFLPAKAGARDRRIAELASVEATLVFYESPRRVAESLAALAAGLGSTREAVMARELTKLFEENRRGTLADLAAALGAESTPKGEIVLVVGPPNAPPAAPDLDSLLRIALTGGSVKDAAAEVARQTGLPKRDIYQRALAMAQADEKDGP